MPIRDGTVKSTEMAVPAQILGPTDAQEPIARLESTTIIRHIDAASSIQEMDSSMMAEFVMVVQPTKTEKEKRTKPDSPSLVIYCLGPFRAYQDDQPVTDWPSSKGKSIFKYLITHREHPVAKDILMELFWPGSSPDSARNNLNVAIYGLRQALRKVRPSFSHVLLS